MLSPSHGRGWGRGLRITECQGWRLDIPRFPELVKYGAVRPCSVAYGHTGLAERGDCVFNTEPYGPFFYTPDDVREILAFATERHITVVPEIEMPGHIRALLAAHPEFSCRGDLPRVPNAIHAIEEDVLCAGNDDAIRFMEQVYDEVCDLFPDAYIHIGGDECPKTRWKECPKCNPMGCSPPGSSVRGILETRILEWIAIPICRRSS